MLKSKTKTKPQKMREQAGEVMDRLAPHVESAREKAAPYVAEARKKADPYVTEAREKAGPYLAEARKKADPYLTEAREKAGPYVAEAREKASPMVDQARARFNEEVLPVVTAAVAAASEATEEWREEASKRGHATAAAIKGELEAPQQKKTHKFRNFLLLLGLGGAAAYAAKRMSDRQASTAWQSSYTPTPASTNTTPSFSSPGVGTTEPPVDDTPMGTAAAAAAAKAHEADDEGAAGPDEAASDAAEKPHKATTPDKPAEEVKVDDDKS